MSVSNVHPLEDEPPGSLLVLRVLLGQMDGRVEITDQALAIAERMNIVTWRDEARQVRVVQVEGPAGRKPQTAIPTERREQ